MGSKLDRLPRSTRDLLNTMETINEARGKFQSISEPWANTTTHAGKMIMTIFTFNVHESTIYRLAAAS